MRTAWRSKVSVALPLAEEAPSAAKPLTCRVSTSSVLIAVIHVGACRRINDALTASGVCSCTALATCLVSGPSQASHLMKARSKGHIKHQMLAVDISSPSGGRAAYIRRSASPETSRLTTATLLGVPVLRSSSASALCFWWWPCTAGLHACALCCCHHKLPARLKCCCLS